MPVCFLASRPSRPRLRMQQLQALVQWPRSHLWSVIVVIDAVAAVVSARNFSQRPQSRPAQSWRSHAQKYQFGSSLYVLKPLSTQPEGRSASNFWHRRERSHNWSSNRRSSSSYLPWDFFMATSSFSESESACALCRALNSSWIYTFRWTTQHP